MSVARIDRVDSLLKRVVADAMFRIMQTEDVGAGLITVTGVSCAKDLRNATVRVSVFGDENVQKRAIGRIARHTHEFERAVNREIRMKFTPRLRFVLDRSLEKGDETLAILNNLSIPVDEPATAQADESMTAAEPEAQA
jgi:ribosome-binding factor A